MRVRFHVKARVEILEIVEHYENADDGGLAYNFFSELRQLIDQIVQRPESFPLINSAVRKAVLRHFPYQILFEILDKGRVKILVVRHNRRDPSYGMRRR